MYMSASQHQIDILRNEFLEKLEKEDPSFQLFHVKDIERVKSCDRWLQLFLEQCDLDMKLSMEMLWSTCTWRKSYGANDISVDNINMDYINAGLIFPHNKDKDGKTLIIFKTAKHKKGSRNVDDLIRCLVYWIERLHSESNYNQVTVFFDMQNAGTWNMDMEFTRKIIELFKKNYPHSLNYIIVFEMAWILNAAFKIIKGLLPAKAAAIMKFVNTDTIKELISEDNMLRSWGGKDDYDFSFQKQMENSERAPAPRYNSLNINGSSRKVHFANSSPPNSPTGMAEVANHTFAERGDGKKLDEECNKDGEMLLITPENTIVFNKNGNELAGTVDITNVSQGSVTYKIKTTSPEKFRVRPSNGVLAPGAKTVVTVVLQEGQNLSSSPPTKDKFLVMCMSLEQDAATSTQAISDLWKNTQSSNPLVELHRLKCSSTTAGTNFNENGRLSHITGDSDRPTNNSNSMLKQLTETSKRLESQVKFTQTLQWITMLLFVLLSIAVMYILLKLDINCMSSDDPSAEKLDL